MIYRVAGLRVLRQRPDVARLAPLRRARRGRFPEAIRATCAFVGAEDAIAGVALFAGGDFDEAMEVLEAAAPTDTTAAAVLEAIESATER